MKILKKELTYSLPYKTESDIRKAVALRNRLYEKFNQVSVYLNGLHEVRIVAEDRIK
jgi:hypothetical protein